MTKLKSSTIIHASIFIFFVTMMAIFISMNYYNNKLTQAIDSQVKETLGKDCNYASSNLKLSLQQISDDLSYISERLTEDGKTPDKQTLKQLISNYKVTSSLENAHFMYSSSLTSLYKNEKLSSFEKVLLNNYLAGQTISIIHENNAVRLFLSVPIYRENKIAGLLYTSYSLDYFQKQILISPTKGDFDSYIVGQNLELLTPMSSYHTLEQAFENYKFPSNVTINTIKDDFANNRSNIMVILINGQKYYLHYAPCNINNWFIVSICQEEDAINHISILSNATRQLCNQLIGIVAVLLIILLVVHCFICLRNNKNTNRLLLERACYETAFELTNGVLWEYNIKADTLTKSDPDQGIMTPLAITEHFKDFINDTELIFKDDLETFYQFYWNLIDGCDGCTTEIRAKDITGSYKWFEITATAIRDNDNHPILVIGQCINIDAEKRTLEQIKASRELDSLTKLYNRKTAEAKISSLIAGESESRIHALLIMDIDNFKQINHTYGYVFGDALLVELAARLSKQYKSEGNVLSRVGGDCFLIYLSDISSASYAIEQGQNVLNILQETFKKQDENTHISGNVGLSLYPIDGTKTSTLLCKASTALAYSKNHGSNNVSLYNNTYMEYTDYNVISDEIRTRNNYQPMDQSIIDSSLITNTVEILFDARDMESSINMILGIIGSYYDLCYIAVIEKSEKDSNGIFTYTWSMSSEIDLPEDFQIPATAIQVMDQYNRNHNNIYYSNSISELEEISPSLADSLRQYKITGFLECGINNNGQPLGYIAFTYTDSERMWTDSEVDSISLITKILGGYIFNIRAQAKAHKLQRIDPLTSANNLTAFSEDATRLIYNNPNTAYVLFYADIDKFKLFNDTYGYSEGDRLLIEFANALNSITDHDECFGRVTADKFIGLFNYNNPKHFLGKMRLLHDIMNQIPRTESENYRVSIIIGLCPISDSRNLSIIIDRANIARKSITNRHKSRYAFFNEAMKSDLVKQREIEDIMEVSLANDDFLVYLQPKFYLNNRQICGAEALVRWQHPTKGLIPPNDFIPIFEENQFVIKLDYYVFEQTCKHIRSMLNANQKVYPVSVNMSRLHLNNNEILTKLKEIVDKYQIPTHYLELELTESALQENSSYMFSILFQLHNMGFIISMDDFGSGLSSLNLLRTLPFDELKLDKDFFQQGSSTERERIVITNIVRMAQDLHMTIVSEGVETQEQADFLSSINCDIAQGFLFAKPMPIEEFERIYYPTVN